MTTKFGTGPLQQKIFAYLQERASADAKEISTDLKLLNSQVLPVVSDGVKRNILTATEDNPRRYRYDGPAVQAQTGNGAQPNRKSYRRKKPTNGFETLKSPPAAVLHPAIDIAVASLQIRIQAYQEAVALLLEGIKR